MDGCIVKQKFASDSKTTTSHCVLITVLLCHLYLKLQYDIKRAKKKKAPKLNKHNQFNHTPKMVKSIYLLFCEKLHTTQSQAY